VNPTASSSSSASGPAWERRLHAELRRLPDLTAPVGLVPGVMAAIRVREAMCARVWYRRPVTLWHPALRMTFATVALALLGALIVGAHVLAPEIAASSAAQTLASCNAKLHALWSAGRAVVDSLGLIAQAAMTPQRLAVLGAIALFQLLLLGAGGAALRASLLSRARASDPMLSP
jgi:hypothetical protein